MSTRREWTTSLGGTLQNGIGQMPEGVGHTHWNRNGLKPNEEWRVGCPPPIRSAWIRTPGGGHPQTNGGMESWCVWPSGRIIMGDREVK